MLAIFLFINSSRLELQQFITYKSASVLTDFLGKLIGPAVFD